MKKRRSLPDPIHHLSRKYKTPKQVQKFLRKLPYNRTHTLFSAETSARQGTAHCFEAAILAAAILERHGYPPLVISFESRDDLDHVIFVFQQKGKWGAIGRSRDEGLHGRPPIYRTLKELALSYYEPYVDKTGEILAFQIAHLDDSGADWRFSSRNVWKAENYLLEIRHQSIRQSRKYYQKIKKSYLKNGPMKRQKFWW
jgi:hypothetical protein